MGRILRKKPAGLKRGKIQKYAKGDTLCHQGDAGDSLMIVLGTGLLILALTSMVRPSQKMNFTLFKYASLYMLGSMILLALS